MTDRIHRVGTVTLGMTLIILGLIFLINIFVPAMGTEIVLKAWPCIFIILGIEILVGNARSTYAPMVYDKAAILLVSMLTVFALCMGFLSQLINYGLKYSLQF